MEGFEGMPHDIKQRSPNDIPNAPEDSSGDFSRAPLGLTGQNAHPQTLRTFQSDLADTIKSGEGSIVKIAMAENRKKERERENIDPAALKNRLFMYGGITLAIVAIAALGYIGYLKLPKTVSVSRTQSNTPTLITTDSIKGLNVTNLSRDNVRDMIGQEYTNASQTINTIEQVVPFTQTDQTQPQHLLTTEEFFKTLQSSIPTELLRSLDPTFTIGIYAYNGSGLFLAFKTNSYNTAFAGMLSWENDIFDEFYRIFAIPSAGSSLFAGHFKDMVIKNQDTRALVDDKGRPVLFYTFLGEDKSIIIITNNQDTLQEVVNRLTANTLRH